MKTYLLSRPTAGETKLAKTISGSTRRRADWTRFPAGERLVRVEGGRGPAAVIGRTGPASDDLFETLLLTDALRRSGADPVMVVAPYLAYSRQDRISKPGEALTSSLVTACLAAAGASGIITVDLHSERVKDGSPIPVIDAPSTSEMAAVLGRLLRGKEFTVAAPDYGARRRADRLAAALRRGKKSVWIEKVRLGPGRVRAGKLHGELKGEIAVLVDDMLDTGSTVAGAAALLKSSGFKRLFLCVTHPIFSGAAARLIGSIGFEAIIVSDSLPLPPPVAKLKGIRVVGTSTMINRVLKRPYEA